MRYSEDMGWAYTHEDELRKKYPNQYVAVVDKEVVAASRDIHEVRREAKKKTGKGFVAIKWVGPRRAGMMVDPSVYPVAGHSRVGMMLRPGV